MSEPRTLVIKPERFGSGGGTYPVDPIAGSTSSEPRSLVVGNERMTPAQNVEVGVASVPTRLIGGDAITIGQEGFDYSVNLDIRKLSPVEGPASPTQWVAIWSEGSGTDEIRRIPTQAIPNDAPQDGEVYGRWMGQWVDVTEYVTIDWSDINNLPTEFPPAPHTHPWDEVTAKPSTFPPDPHQHPISDVTNLQAQLNAKEPTIAPGDPALFWAGDKTWKATPGLDTAAGDLRYVLKIGDTMTGSLLLPNGTNSLPALAFSGDPDTGIYSGGGNVLRIATGGTQRVSVGQTGIDFSIPLREADGSQTAPSLTFSNDADTGIYRVGTDQLGFTTGGVLKLTLSTTALTSTLPIVLPIAAPTADAQAANKKYVDDKIAGAASATSIADTAPGTPTQGQLWWQSNTGVFSISYNDGNTTQWVQVNGAGIPEAPVDGKAYSRKNNGWIEAVSAAGFVAKTGDVMTGHLSIGYILPSTPHPAQFWAGPIGTTNYTFNAYLDAASVWKVASTGTSALHAYNPANGVLTYMTAPSVAAGAASNLVPRAYWNPGGSLVLGASNLTPEPTASTVMGFLATGMALGWNSYYSTSAYYRQAAGHAWTMNVNGTNGSIELFSGNGSGAVGSAITYTRTVEFQPGLGGTNFMGTVNAPTLLSSGNVTATGHHNIAADANFFMGQTSNIRYMQFVSQYGFSCELATNTIWCREGTIVYWQLRPSDGAFIISHNPYKPGGGPWLDSSDSRIKDVHGNYEHGLAEIMALRPVRYSFKGNLHHDEPVEPEPLSAEDREAGLAEPLPPPAAHADTTKEYVGLVAQEAETVMPELVTQQSGWIDGKQVDDLRILDSNALLYALVNAVKELKAEIDAMKEAR